MNLKFKRLKKTIIIKESKTRHMKYNYVSTTEFYHFNKRCIKLVIICTIII